MPLLLFLNERSCGTDCDPLRASHAMGEFARTAVAVARADRTGTVLVSAVPLKHLQIADGYPVGKWIGDPRNRDVWQRLRRVQSKAPYRVVYPNGEERLDVEYRHEGVPAHGLGGAHLMDGLALSLPVHERWEATALPLEREELVESPDGDTQTLTSEVEVRHLSAERHLETHRPWMRTARQVDIRTGADLWERRSELFPHLQFLPRVEQNFHDLAGASLGVVRRRLAELEAAVVGWDPETTLEPAWPGSVRGEFSQRRRECWFTDLDGQSRLFDLHVNFPPAPGRLHFRLVREAQTVRVAYAGRKLGR